METERGARETRVIWREGKREKGRERWVYIYIYIYIYITRCINTGGPPS